MATVLLSPTKMRRTIYVLYTPPPFPSPPPLHPSLPSHLLPEEVHGNVIRQLSTHTEDDTLRLFQLVDLHYRLKRDLIKIQPVGEQFHFYSHS